MNLRKLRWALLLYVAFDLFFGGKCGGFFDLDLAAAAQFTTVSGTVTDPNGLPYANGTISATLNASASPTLGGFSYQPPTQPTGLNGAGAFVMNLADNTQLLPGGSTWTFQVCSAQATVPPAFGSGPICFTSAPITISGTSQSITSQLSAAALPLTTSFVANVSSTGGTFLGTTSGFPLNTMSTGLTVSGPSPNTIEGFTFIQPWVQSVGHLSVRSNVSLGVGSHWSVGVYNLAGNLVFWTGALDGTIIAVQNVPAKNVAGASISYTMNPGVYTLAITATVGGAGNTTGFTLVPSSAVVNQFINNANANRQVVSGTATVGGVLPAAIGTLSPDNQNIAMVAMFAEP